MATSTPSVTVVVPGAHLMAELLGGRDERIELGHFDGVVALFMLAE